MMLFKKQAYFLFKGILVAGLYVAFFFVQLFFNFDLSSSQKQNAQTYVSQNEKGQQSDQHTIKINKTNSVKKNIRLNKRFQPSGSLDFNFPAVNPIVKYCTPISIDFNYQEAILNTVTLSASLRGPPAIA